MLFETFAVGDLFVPCFIEQLQRPFVAFLNLCDHFSLVVAGRSKLLNNLQYFGSNALSSVSPLGQHNVNLAFVLFNPLREEQVDITHHCSIPKDDEGVLAWVFKPGLLVIQLLFQS